MISQLGRYEIIEELGRGSMGIVYKAKDPLIERLVAIKVIDLASLTKDEIDEYEARFYHEARSAGRLNHSNIFTIHDMGKSGDVAYIAMEILEGRELQEVMEVQGLSIDEALNISIQVASGLGYAHRHGIVHRDIKPANIMVRDDNHVKIADFGIAEMTSALAGLNRGKILGSPLYMSPEQIQGHPVDVRSDIFSFGIVMYQMLTRRLPFTGDDAHSVMFKILNDDPPLPSSLNDRLPKMLDKVVSKCLAKKASARYQNADDLADDLRSCRELLRGFGASHYQFTASSAFKRLRRLAIPGGVPRSVAVIGSYMAIVAIFLADVFTDATVQMHLLYVFPISVLGFHCEGRRLIGAAVALSIVLQAITLESYDAALPAFSKFILATLILPSNIIVAYVSRVARANFLEVDHLASFDWLTGLRNRQSFESIIEMEIKRQRRYGGIFSVAYIELDNFKKLNRSRGLDDALNAFAQVMREHVRQSDTVARLGEDEFAILMPNTRADACEKLCEQFSALMASRINIVSFAVSASIGHMTFEQAPESISEVLERVCPLDYESCHARFSPESARAAAGRDCHSIVKAR